jgi:hypothetical protein
MVPLYRLSEYRCIVEDPVCPATIDKLDGEALILKSGWITCKHILTECDIESPIFWPVTITLYLPAEAVEGTDKLIVVAADLLYFIDKEGEAKLAVTPVSAKEDRMTVPLNL